MTPAEYLKLPYTRAFNYDKDSNTYTARILEFPGCITQGDTLEETWERLDMCADGWLHAMLAKGKEIPEPQPEIFWFKLLPEKGMSRS